MLVIRHRNPYGQRDMDEREPMTDTPVSEMSFEAAMAELEAVLGKLERGDVALDDSIALYERGAALKARCETKLKEAEEKVAAITLDADGNPAGLKPVEGL
jgi:exodeoxyribonuclease VII small subunit